VVEIAVVVGVAAGDGEVRVGASNVVGVVEVPSVLLGDRIGCCARYAVKMENQSSESSVDKAV